MVFLQYLSFEIGGIISVGSSISTVELIRLKSIPIISTWLVFFSEDTELHVSVIILFSHVDGSDFPPYSLSGLTPPSVLLVHFLYTYEALSYVHKLRISRYTG